MAAELPVDAKGAGFSSDIKEPNARLLSWMTPLSFAVGVALSLFVLIEVNFSILTPLRQLSLFVTAGLVLCFLQVPLHPKLRHNLGARVVDCILAVSSVGCCVYLFAQGASLGQRAAEYTQSDLWVGVLGMVLVIEAARRTVGWALPVLAILFIAYAHQSISQSLPEWLFPHRGQDWEDLIGQTYLRTEGIFGTAVGVMFRYVFLFVLFGGFLQASGATSYIIGLAMRLFGNRAGGPAKVSVLASGMMGSLSGSAVANAATTGTFTIPLMKSIGFKPHIAAGVEAAASSGGALVPPVMGAGAYMMLEIINRDPAVTYLEVLQSALIPAILYYLSIFLLVHFYARRIETERDKAEALVKAADVDKPELLADLYQNSGAGKQDALAVNPGVTPKFFSIEGLAFFGSLGGLMAFLLVGFSPFRAVTYAMAIVLSFVLINPATPVRVGDRVRAILAWGILTVLARYFAPAVANWGDALIWSMAGLMLIGLFASSWRGMLSDSFRSTAEGGLPLIVAAACVGIVIGLVSRTGIGTGVPQAIIPLAGSNLFLGLVAIMFCSLILGMGLPSAVSYLLLATIIGPVFADPSLGVPILAAHLFIFYFGMMAMVTPPVALAAYATASIAKADVMRSSVAAFRFSLAGFTLPFMFVYRPALCLMGETGGPPLLGDVVVAVLAAVIGILALASALAGFLFKPLSNGQRVLLFVAAACALFPDQFGLFGNRFQLFDGIGAGLLVVVGVWNYRSSSE
ncbi:TRAP transporter permease [Pirellulaceae bacterium SH449]